MYSVQPQSLTDDELLRQARIMVTSSLGNGLSIPWQMEILRRLEIKRDADAQKKAPTDPRQLTLF